MLLPYVALAVAAAVILSQLLLIAGKIASERETQASVQTGDSAATKAKPNKRARTRASTGETDDIPF